MQMHVMCIMDREDAYMGNGDYSFLPPLFSYHSAILGSANSGLG